MVKKISKPTSKSVSQKPAKSISRSNVKEKAEKEKTLLKAKAKKGANPKTKAAPNSKAIKLVSKATAHEMMARLKALYPDADCELNFDSPFQLLTAVIMSAQTTDVQVNKVTGKLFSRFPTAKALAEGSIEEIKEIIKPTGYYNAKAQSIQTCAQQLVLRFGGKVPDTLEELTTLPGVGRKTANVVLGVEFGQRGWTVDTHVQRLTKRLGLTKNADPYKIELDLQKLFPDEDWSQLSITIIWHGRRMCFARNPDCPSCPLKDICPSSEV
jgi:endonuclease III